MREISSRKYEHLKEELHYLKTQGLLGEETDLSRLDALYRVKRFELIYVWIWLAVLLIGTGVLSFVAANWDEISDPVKIIGGIFLFAGCYAAGEWLRLKMPGTSRTFYYLGAALIGANMVLIGQTFNQFGAAEKMLLFWAIAIAPLLWHLRDKFLLAAMMILLICSYFAGLEYSQGNLLNLPWISYGLFLIAFVCNLYVQRSRLVQVIGVAGTVSLTALQCGMIIDQLTGSSALVVAVLYPLLVLAGIGITYWHRTPFDVAHRWTGLIIQFVFGIQMTFPFYWEEWMQLLSVPQIDGIYLPTFAGILFAAIYGIYFLLTIRLHRTISVIAVSLIILRFYFDLWLNFLDKSLYFILAGGIFLALIVWNERRKRKEGEQDAV